MRKIIALVIIFCTVISMSALPTIALSISSNQDVVSASSGIYVNINSLNDGYSYFNQNQSTMPPHLFKDTPVLGTTIGNLQPNINQPSDTSTRGIEDPEMGVIDGGGNNQSDIPGNPVFDI